MKNKYLLIILIFIISCSKETVLETDLKKMQLNGKMKFVKVSQYKVVLKNGVIEKEKFKKSENIIYPNNHFYFNREGMIKEQEEYILDKLNERSLFYYDKNLNIVKKETYNSSEKLINEFIFENDYNINGEIIEQKEFIKKSKFNGEWTQKKFKNGRKIAKIIFSKTDTLKSYNYEYDKRGNLIKEYRYNNDGSLFIEINNLFDENNYRIEEIVSGGENEMISKEIYKYLEFDSFNNIKKVLISENKKPTKLVELKIEYYK